MATLPISTVSAASPIVGRRSRCSSSCVALLSMRTRVVASSLRVSHVFGPVRIVTPAAEGRSVPLSVTVEMPEARR